MKLEMSLRSIVDMMDPLEVDVSVSSICDCISNSEDSEGIWALLNEAFENDQDGDIKFPFYVAHQWMQDCAEDVISEAGYVLDEENICYVKADL